MNLSEEVQILLEEADYCAQQKKYEYVTPELILLMLCDTPEFDDAWRKCGGNVKSLKWDLEHYLDKSMEAVENVAPSFSAGSLALLSFAQQSAEASGNEEIMIRHVVNALYKLQDSYAYFYLIDQEVDKVDLLRVLSEESHAENGLYPWMGGDMEDEDEQELEDSDKNQKSTEKWQLYAPCLNDDLEEQNPLIGREDELERTIQILCRKEKNNPLHIGEPGVGKTAITYGLARRIEEGKVPQHLLGSRIFALDLAGMLAGTQYRGDFEKRFKKVLSEIEKEKNPIIYIDEIHNLSGAGAVRDSSLDASNMLKPYLSSGRIRFIGATTFEEYKKYFEKNKSLARRFQNVEIKEPSEEETVEILQGLKAKYEEFHGVTYEDGVLEYIVRMSAKHVNERFLPDKAIDLLDEAGAYRKLHLLPGGRQTVDQDVVNEILTKICRVPLETVQTNEIAGLSTLRERLLGQIFGQDEAIGQVVNAIKFSRAGLLEEGKPLASLLFVGPTGVGKTEIARSLARELGVKLIRFDMSEYGEKHAVAKLIGSPAGYVGYEEGGLLTEEIRKAPFAVLLLDEIEKAHADIYNLLLQVMDYATLTDNQGRKADFRNVVLIMTSNAGASRIGKKGIGFQSVSEDASVIMEEVNKTFQPEFRNRLNRIVVFHGMDDAMAQRIMEKKLGELKAMLEKKGIILKVEKPALELLQKKGVSTEFGAREIDRVIRNEIKPLLVDDILFGEVQKERELFITARDGQFIVEQDTLR